MDAIRMGPRRGSGRRVVELLSGGAALLILTAPTGRGRTIEWASSAAPEPEGSPIVHFDSNGLALDLTMTIEFGGFANGFVPTLSNIDLWHPNWRPLGGSTHVPTQNYFFGEVDIADNSVFAAGQPMFLWVFNTPADVADSQWALITDDSSDGDPLDDWVFPTITGAPGEASVAFHLTTASVPLFGGVNNLHGAGGFLADPQTFRLQTHEAPYAIPEFSSSALIMLGFVFGASARSGTRRMPRWG
jgi:hypothetical protein